MIKWLKKIICKVFRCKISYSLGAPLGFSEDLIERLKRMEKKFAEKEENG